MMINKKMKCNQNKTIQAKRLKTNKMNKMNKILTIHRLRIANNKSNKNNKKMIKSKVKMNNLFKMSRKRILIERMRFKKTSTTCLSNSRRIINHCLPKKIILMFNKQL